MPNLTLADLQRLRTWRTYVLAASCFAQGAQYAGRPAFPAGQATYATLTGIWGLRGWVGFGVLQMAVAGWIALAPPRQRWLGFLAGFWLYGALCLANALAGVVPAVLALPAGLCAGEVRAHVWQSGEDR